MQAMEEVFSFDDSIVIAAFKVFKHKRSEEFTGSKLIKALGNNVGTSSNDLPPVKATASPPCLSLVAWLADEQHAINPDGSI